VATLIEIDGVAPTIGRDVFLAPTAVLAGDVRVGDRASIWFGAVLRGDLSHVEIGEDTSIQDGAVLHCDRARPTIVGRRVTIGHNAMLEGCVIEDGALVGMGAIVLHDVRVGAGAIVAAGSVVPDRGSVAAGTLAAGVPAREKKRLDGESRRYPEQAADEYGHLRERYLAASAMRDSDDPVAAP
jgi:carbonic anhydrase/acetyltransferase-like protein (isoleucine patch superfamily)